MFISDRGTITDNQVAKVQSPRQFPIQQANKRQKQNEDDQEYYVGDAELDILFKGLQKPHFNFKPYLLFLQCYIFNAVFLLPCFIVKAIIQFPSLMNNKDLIQIIKTIICVIIDLVLAISVQLMYVIVILPQNKQYAINFQYWAISNSIFLQCYVLLQSYLQTIAIDRNELKFSELLSDQNINSMGLGQIINYMNSNQQQQIDRQIILLREEFDESIQIVLDEENIDSTLFYISLEGDEGIIQSSEFSAINSKLIHQLISKAIQLLNQPSNQYQGNNPKKIDIQIKRDQMLKLLRPQGFKGKRHIIDDFLWPHFKQIRQQSHLSKFNLISIICIVVIVKISYPYYAIHTSQYNEQIYFQYILLSLFIGIQLNIFLNLKDLIFNVDLKDKRYLLKILKSLIYIDFNDTDLSNMDEEQDSIWTSGSEIPIQNQFKLDLSCNLSLESWDNTRRITMQLGQKISNRNEKTFIFLTIYLLYAYLVLSSDFLQFDLFPQLQQFFKSPIQEWNMMIDFLLISIVFLKRVHEGSLYNQQFDGLIQTITNIASVYEDKKALFDFYFGSGMIDHIQNKIYRKLAQAIQITSIQKLIYKFATQNEQIKVQKFKRMIKDESKLRVIQLCSTMEKLVDQINFDSEHQCHKFLGLFKSDITKVFSSFVVLIYLFFHQKIKAWMRRERVGNHHHHHLINKHF